MNFNFALVSKKIPLYNVSLHINFYHNKWMCYNIKNLAKTPKIYNCMKMEFFVIYGRTFVKKTKLHIYLERKEI